MVVTCKIPPGKVMGLIVDPAIYELSWRWNWNSFEMETKYPTRIQLW